jgi:alpha,alpha-trehalose phosphorylase
MLGYRTKESGMTLGCGIEHAIETSCPYTVELNCSEDCGEAVFLVDALAKKPFQIVKYLSYHSSADAHPQELCTRAGFRRTPRQPGPLPR